MKKTKKKTILSIVLTTAILTCGVITASANYCEPDGGKWQYGIDDYQGTVYSNYWHPSLKHYTSVKGYQGYVAQSAHVGPNEWANVSYPKNWTDNHSYYNFC